MRNIGLLLGPGNFEPYNFINVPKEARLLGPYVGFIGKQISKLMLKVEKKIFDGPFILVAHQIITFI